MAQGGAEAGKSTLTSMEMVESLDPVMMWDVGLMYSFKSQFGPLGL